MLSARQTERSSRAGQSRIAGRIPGPDIAIAYYQLHASCLQRVCTASRCRSKKPDPRICRSGAAGINQAVLVRDLTPRFPHSRWLPSVHRRRKDCRIREAVERHHSPPNVMPFSFGREAREVVPRGARRTAESSSAQAPRPSSEASIPRHRDPGIKRLTSHHERGSCWWDEDVLRGGKVIGKPRELLHLSPSASAQGLSAPPRAWDHPRVPASNALPNK